MDKTWIAIGTSLGILLATVTIVMIIYFWKIRNRKGISNIFLTFCVLTKFPKVISSKYNTNHVLKCVSKKSVELYLCFTESVATSLKISICEMYMFRDFCWTLIRILVHIVKLFQPHANSPSDRREKIAPLPHITTTWKCRWQ